MEGKPKTAAETDTSDDDSEGSSSKSKKAGRLGAIIVEKPSASETKSEQPKKKLPSLREILGDAPGKVAEGKTDKAGSKPEEVAVPPELTGLKSELSDTEVQGEALAADEAVAVRQSAARERKAELSQEVTGEADSEQAVAEAFLEHVEETGDVKAAEALTKAEFNLDDTPASVAETGTVESADQSMETVIDMSAPHEGEVPLSAQTAETDAEDADDASHSSHASSTSGTTTVPPAAGAGGGSGGAGSPPSGPGFTPGGPPFGGGPIPTPNLFRSAASTPNVASSPNMISTEDSYYYERRALQRGLLTGAIVGFLYGRRRGRIKAEKRFAPVQKKLEKRVTALQSEVYEAEQQLRKQAAAQVRAGYAVRVPAERLGNQSSNVFERADQRGSVLPLEQQPLRAERLPRPAPERIGHVLVRAGETVAAAAPGESPAAADKANKITIEKQVEIMGRRELLELSEKIVIDGANLRQIYETHLVGEQALRRLVAEHLRGGDIHKVLRRELVEREIDFERDPILRDKARASLSGGGNQALNSLLQKAGVNSNDDDEIKAVQDAKATHDKKQQAKQQRHRRLIDAGLTGTIAVLIALILLIILR